MDNTFKCVRTHEFKAFGKVRAGVRVTCVPLEKVKQLIQCLRVKIYKSIRGITHFENILGIFQIHSSNMNIFS